MLCRLCFAAARYILSTQNLFWSLRRTLIWGAAPSPAKGTRPFGIPSLEKCFLGRLPHYFAVAALLRPLANFPGKAGKTARCSGGKWQAPVPGRCASVARACHNKIFQNSGKSIVNRTDKGYNIIERTKKQGRNKV